MHGQQNIQICVAVSLDDCTWRCREKFPPLSVMQSRSTGS